jgi:hypothetical protein
VQTVQWFLKCHLERSREVITVRVMQAVLDSARTDIRVNNF